MPTAGAIGIDESKSPRELAPPAVDAQPDWSAIDETIHCPHCDNDLRGLIEPLCPECGYRFAWHELLDEQLRGHPFLFEYARRRLRWSFVRTNLAGWLPQRFWRSVQPQQRINLPRL